MKIEQRYLTYRQTAKLLGIGLTTLHRLRRNGKISPKKWSARIVRFDVEEIKRLIKSLPAA